MKNIKISVKTLALILFIIALSPLRSYAAVRQRAVNYKGYISSLTFSIVKHKENITKFIKPVIIKKNPVVSALKMLSLAFKGIKNPSMIHTQAGVYKAKGFMPAGVTKKNNIKSIAAYGFGFNSYRINKLLAERLNYIKSLIKNKKVISIMGYTDNFGTKAYNNKLALERAKSAEKYLGLKNIKLYGYGKCCYISKINLKDRRVVIKY